MNTVLRFKCEACGERSLMLCEHYTGAPDPRDARIATLEAEVARLEALIVRTVEEATGIDADLHMEADRIRDRAVESRMSDPREKGVERCR